jgi:hypothetical protein
MPSLPGFAAETTLYRTNRQYRALAGNSQSTALGVLPADATGDCLLGCAALLPFGVVGCGFIGVLFGPIGLGVCGTLLGGAFAACALGCNAVRPPPPPECCPVGSTCSCGGQCMPLAGGGQVCVGGLCLRPGEECP